MLKASEQSAESLTNNTSAAKPAEECKVCGFKYSHKCSIQDHIFTKQHIATIRSWIESGKLAPEAGSGEDVAIKVCTEENLGQPAPPPLTSCAVAPSPVNNDPYHFSENGEEDEQVEEEEDDQRQHQAAFLQQLQLLQMATSSTDIPASVQLENSEADNSCSTNNKNGSSSLSPEDLLQLYGLGSLVDGSGATSSSAGPFSSSSSYSQLMQHPPLSTSTTSNTTFTSSGNNAGK